MRRIRVHVDGPLAGAREVALPRHAVEHLVRVLRLGAGAPVTCFDGDGYDYPGLLRRTADGGLAVVLGEREHVALESPLALTLLQSVARGEKMDHVLQKATELGVLRIVPVISERTEVRLDPTNTARRLEHWRRVVRSASEQCGRAVVPEVHGPAAVTAIAGLDAGALKLALDPGAATGLAAAVAGGVPSAIAVAVGPEGGFSQRDLDALARQGFQPVRLGPRVLRTETAGPAALAVLQALAGDLR